MQKGRSMIEMLAVLVIITVLTIGAMAGWRHTRQKMYVTETQNEIALIEQDISNLFSWSRGYPDIEEAALMEILCQEGVDVFPSGCTEAGKAYHPLDKGLASKEGVYKASFSNGYLFLKLYNLPSYEICTELGTAATELRHFNDFGCTGGAGSIDVTLTLKFE